MTTHAMSARIERAVEAAIDALASLEIETRAPLGQLANTTTIATIDLRLVDDARRALLDGPHRFVRIDEQHPVLEGVLNLRRAITHRSINPLDVGSERAHRACTAVRLLDDLERELASELDDARARLAYDTARFLNPPPPFTGAPIDEPGEGVLADLVERWERERARPEPLLPWLARKAKQHFQFYRIGFAFPLYEGRRRRIAARLPASVRSNEGMRETFEALEQLGPVLDNFVFDCGPTACFRDDVAIADLVFLLMQLADELVDNLAKLGGRGALDGLLGAHFDCAARASVFVPFEDLTAASLRSVGIDPESAIPKYELSVAALIAVIAELRSALVLSIDRVASAARIRTKVRDFFHHCFATFLDELELPRLAGTTRLDRLPRGAVAWHFHRKNDEVMARWLGLRATLLGLDETAMPDVLASWGQLLASFQIFDDLKDVAVDLGHQPNYAVAIAARHHPHELAFLEHGFGSRDLSLDRNDVMELAVRMPGTIRDCLRLGRLLALSSFDWFLDYVADYRWRRNWLVRSRSFHRAPPPNRGDRPIELGALGCYEGVIDSGVPIIDAIFRYLAATEGSIARRELDDETLGFVLDVVGYDHGGAVLAALFPRIRAMYRFLNLRMRMTSGERADVLRRVVAHHRAASERALVGLRVATGSDALAHRIARGLDLAVPGRTLGLPAST